MSLFLKTSVFVLFISPCCFSQDPMPVLGSSWERTIQRVQKPVVPESGPARALNDNDKPFQRNAREMRPDITVDPNEGTIDSRRAALEKVVQESRTLKPDDLKGYTFRATVRNDGGKTVRVIFWEYRFTEIARPTNVVRRQFLCSVNLKNGDSTDLPVFTLLGPSETIDAESLAKSGEKLFDEKVLIDRIEFADGTMRQRGTWKYEDVQKSVERATSTPWGKEVCRAL